MISLSQVSHILQQDCRLDATRPVLIGVSGGPDSFCLLDIMWRLGYPLLVAHLNHGLRVEAGAEALVVREAAERRGLPFILRETDIEAYARSRGLAIEEAARKVRYQFLFEQAIKHQAQAVAVAHTADDQIETVLMHLLRGAGLSGLKGMSWLALPNPWSETLAVVRPLLGIFREQVQDYCDEQGLRPVYDRSNLDTTIYRNRIRKSLIPTLETYNAGVKSHLLRMAQTLSGDDIVLENFTRDVWQECCLEQSPSGVALKINVLMAQPLGIQRRLVRWAISFLRPGLRDINYMSIERTLAFVQQPTRSTELDLIDGLRLLLEDGKLWIANREGDLPTGEWPQMIKTHALLPVPGRVDLHYEWRIQAAFVENVQGAMAQSKNNTDSFQAWIDIFDHQPSLLLRSRFPGDRFQPLGMDGHHVNLSAFMVNTKMPRRARGQWPLVCLGNDIAWIPGFRISHFYRLTASSKRAVHLRLFKGQ